MRIKSVLKSVSASIISYMILFLAGILVRKLFLRNFEVELLGYEGLFSSVFMVLSAMDLGAGSMFSYMLYQALAQNDTKEISIIMSMYQKLYRCIGMLVFLAGTVIYFFLPYIIQENTQNGLYVRAIYLIQLAGTLVSYFLAYKRALLIADQQNFEVVTIETFYKAVNLLIRAVIIITVSDYILYALVPLAANLAVNIHLSSMAEKRFPGVFHTKVSMDDFKSRNIVRQLKDTSFTRIALMFYNSADSILVSMLAGITNMGLLTNYNTINEVLKLALSYITVPLGSAAGNFIYTETKEKTRDFYFILDFICFIFAGVSAAFYVCCFQKAVGYVFGKQYVMSIFVPAALGADFYVRCRGIVYSVFQGALGHYDIQKKYSVVSAFVNIILSVLLGIYFGVAGILSATAIGNIIIHAGRAKVTAGWIEGITLKSFLVREIQYMTVSAAMVMVSLFLTGSAPWTLVGVLGSAVTAAAVCGLMIVLFFRSTARYRMTVNYVKDLKAVFIHSNKGSKQK